MSLPGQGILPLVGPHRNSGLFADNYLNSPDRLRAMPEWREAAGVEEVFQKILHLYKQRASKFTKKTNEPQTEQEFIRPVLNILWGEDCYQVQVSIPNVDVRRQPDYAFFCTAANRAAAQPRNGSLEYWSDVPCLGDAKRWYASLDKERGEDENPSAQISNYLYRSRVRWGILTNGRTWRLYEQDKSRAGGIFYEVDLEELLRVGDLERFKFFHLFFRREAFLPDSAGKSFVEQVFQGSVEYATQVGDRLKESVYDALCHVMNGFFEFAGNGLDRQNPEILKDVHDNSLIVLYRLLFILFAEDRGLLPAKTDPYSEYSLFQLHREINQRLREGRTFAPVGHMCWDRLKNLFELIDNGFPDGHIPAYNGGLFTPQKHPHVAHKPVEGIPRWEVGDHRLAPVIDMLAYHRDRWNEPGTRDVDYNTLAVQHLGSIYEGLLELRPRVAAEPLVETTEDGKPVFKPASEVPNPRPIRGQQPRRVSANEVYLVTDRGERKATGSYYTPKYIVDYIVENTIGPLADEAAKNAAALRPEVDGAIRKLDRTRKQWEKGAKNSSNAEARDAAKHSAEHASLIEKEKHRLYEPYLELKILDPAMGSGHFLVGAADFLSMAMATDPNVLAAEDIGDENPQSYYKRLVVERCLYGVDLNPLAVELAKLSLWLHTVSQDKALSFLDHHLRCGNSLIGARIEDDLRYTPPELDPRGRVKKRDKSQLVLGFAETLTTTHLSHFLDAFRKIVETPSGDAETERQKDRWYQEMDAARERYRAVANCWLAPYFGIPIHLPQYAQAVAALRGTPTDWDALAHESWFQQAQTVARENRFFHWELEFPEAFFSPTQSRPREELGFHGLFGNPPYVRPHKIRAQEKGYLWERYSSYEAKSDIYVCFMHLAIDLSTIGACIGMIVSKGWLYLDSFEAIRSRVLGFCSVRSLVELGGGVFEEATVETVVFSLRRQDSSSLRASACVSVARSEMGRIPVTLARISQSEFQSTYKHCFDLSLVENGTGLKPRMRSVSVRLGDIAVIDFGLKTGDDRRYIRSACGSPEDRPLLRGDDVFRYGYEYKGEFVWYVPRDMRRHKPTARPGEPLRFECPKVLVKDTSSSLGAAYDKDSYYAKDVLIIHHVETYEALYVLALVNSRLMSHYYLTSFPTIHVQRKELSELPIRRIDFPSRDPARTQLLLRAKGLYEATLAHGEHHDLLSSVGELLLATPERADVLHDFLAFLADQMIEMTRARQAEAKGFLAWLERAIGAKVGDLANKTKVLEYYEHDMETLLAMLTQNRRRISVDPATRSFQKSVEREFDRSVGKLRPLKAQIAATDRLIDLIVYRLYGLTDEEIAIVEAATQRRGMGP